MKLEHLELKFFRNYEKIELDFHNGVNIFIGENAQGKTNLMESIHTLAMTKSHRTSDEKELIAWNKDYTIIRGNVNRKTHTVPLQLQISKKGKIAKVNHIEQKRLSTYLGQLNVILFAPEHLNLIKGAPTNRRKFINMELGQMNPIYLFELVQYQKLLKQRNSYLKQIALKKKTMDEVFFEVLTEQLAVSASLILHHRMEFVKKLEEFASPIHLQLSHDKEVLTIRYQSLLLLEDQMKQDDIYTLLLEQFQKVRKRELDRVTTLVGPHLDDLIFYLNGHNVQTYGSQGQQRSTILSLKLAEIELMNKMIGEYPILLLDDVLSELDDDRQTHLIKTIENKVQTFLTTTSLDGVKQQFINKPTVYHIKQGNLIG